MPHSGPLYDGLQYPGHGYPPNPGEDRPGLSPFGRLAMKGARGKRVVLKYDDANVTQDQFSQEELFRLEGDDLDACQLVVTLAPPMIVPADPLLIVNTQNVTGEQTNIQNALQAPDFPGTGGPAAWPAFTARLKWGVNSQTEAEIDFINGTQFSVVASFISCQVFIEPRLGTAGTSAYYVCNGFVGPGFTNTCTARKTVFMGTIVDGTESAVFAAPAFAKRAYLVGQSGAAGVPPVTVGYIKFWQTFDGPVSGFGVGSYIYNGNQPFGFEVPNGGQYFTVYNQTGEDLDFNVIFDLALS